MEDEKIASMMAGQTAVLSVLIEMLISADVLDRQKVTNNLYDLASLGSASNSSGVAPVRHLISLIENH